MKSFPNRGHSVAVFIKQQKHFKRKILSVIFNFYTQVHEYLVKFSVFLKYLEALIKQLSSTPKTE